MVEGVGGRGRPKCSIVTEKAGLGEVPHPRGEDLHSFWVYRLDRWWLKKGAVCKMGDTLSGNECDMSVSLNGRNICIEIVVSMLVYENIERHLSVYDEMYVLCLDDKKRMEVKSGISELSDDLRGRIKVELTGDYFVRLYVE